MTHEPFEVQIYNREMKNAFLLLTSVAVIGVMYFSVNAQLRSKELTALADSIPVPTSLTPTSHQTAGRTDCYEEGHSTCKYDRREYSFASENEGIAAYQQLTNHIKSQGYQDLYPRHQTDETFSSELFNKKHGRYQISIDKWSNQRIVITVFDYSGPGWL